MDGRAPLPGALPGVLIRRATAGDLGRVVELLLLGALAGAAPGAETPADLEPYRRGLRDIDDAGGAVLVAERDGDGVVGVCQLLVFRHLQRRGGLCAEIESVHVHLDHRNGGVGAALVAEAVARARALGCYRVQLTSDAASGGRAPLLRSPRLRAVPRRFQAPARVTAGARPWPGRLWRPSNHVIS